jgi:D-hexose-6-phosphate mutarotase
MPKSELVFDRKRIRGDIAARAMLRKNVEISQGNTVQLNCIDMGYRSLNRLQNLHDELCVLYLGLADKQASTAEYPVLWEPWEKSQSHIIPVAELEGGLRPRLRLHP